MKIMATCFKRSHASTAALSALTLQQATTDPCLRRRLLDTYGQVWASLLGDHWSFILGLGIHKVLFVPSKSLMLKIHQARLQQYMNHALPDVQAGFRKNRGTRDQISNIHWIIEKSREFQKNIYFCFIDYAKAFVWITTNYGKFLTDGNTRAPPSLLRKLYAGQESTVRTGHGTTDWFQIGKRESEGCILPL